MCRGRPVDRSPFTGVQGSGRSSLVFDIIAPESQRLIHEIFSTFVQLFLPRYGQPDADALHHLSTAIMVDQQPLGGNPRSGRGRQLTNRTEAVQNR